MNGPILIGIGLVIGIGIVGSVILLKDIEKLKDNEWIKRYRGEYIHSTISGWCMVYL